MFQQINTFQLIVFVLFSAPRTNGVNLKIDGNIDLGPKWTYESSNTQQERKRLVMPDIVSKMIEKYTPKNVTNDIINPMYKDNIESHKYIEPYNEHAVDKDTFYDLNKSTVHKRVSKQYKLKNRDMYVLPRKVKNDPQITDFTRHIYKQSLKIFHAIKDKANDETMKKEIDFLAQSYEEKFGEFVKETQEQKIKTRLGRQKVILNTMETSNLILKRLVNYLVGMDKNVLRSEAAANVFQNEVNKKMDIEKTHVCKKFGICRSQDGFTAFIVDVITVALNADDRKLKTFADAFTEVTKYADFSTVMNVETEKRFRKAIADLEVYDITILKHILYITKNVIANKNKPIEVVGKVDKRVNRTIAALEVMETLENALPPNEKNRLEWEDVKNGMAEWRDEKRNDILEIMQSLIDHVTRGMDNFGAKTSESFERNINLILGYR